MALIDINPLLATVKTTEDPREAAGVLIHGLAVQIEAVKNDPAAVQMVADKMKAEAGSMAGLVVRDATAATTPKADLDAAYTRGLAKHTVPLPPHPEPGRREPSPSPISGTEAAAAAPVTAPAIEPPTPVPAPVEEKKPEEKPEKPTDDEKKNARAHPWRAKGGKPTA